MEAVDWNRDDDYFINPRFPMMEMAILLLLRTADMYGYEINKHLENKMGFPTENSSVYQILKKLQTLGHVTSYTLQLGYRRTRVYYTITGEGRNHYLDLKNTMHFWMDLLNRLDDFS